MRRIRGSLTVAASVAAAALLAGCAGSAAQHSSGTSTGKLTAAGAAKACHLPGYQAGPAAGDGLNGPALTSLTGGAATRGFSLDGGDFSITPARSGDAPRVSRTEAECEALAAVGTNGEPLIYADGVSGMAAGYGLVTVSPRLPVLSWQGYYPGIHLPTPAPERYQSRLAWVVVFRVVERATCPDITATTPPSPTGVSYHGYYYEVFIIDAATGGAALSYDEATPRQCNGTGLFAPSVSIPIELTSVRWELDSHGPNDSYDKLTAYVPSCLDYDKNVQLAFYSNLVPVLAYGQVAASCGPPRPVTVYLEPARGLQRLPLTLTHATTGLYLTGTQQPLAP